MTDRVFRVTACNVQSGIGTTRGYAHYLLTAWKYGLPHHSGPIRKAAAFLRSERIDLAALTEVGGGAWRTRRVDQLALLSSEAGLPERAFFPTLVLGDETRPRVNQGNGVCARFPLRPVRNHPLPGTGEPRFLSEADVRIDGVPTRLFVTHLSLDQAMRARQISAIADVIGHEDRPTILAGDFNVSEEAELELLSESILDRATSAPTFPSWRPARALDHLFFSRHFAIRRTYAFSGFRFSDHLPLVAEVELRP